MAATPRSRPGRTLLIVLVILIGLYVGLFFGDGSKGRTPALGIDLRGGTTTTLTAVPTVGSKAVTSAQLNETVNIVRNRVNGAGVSGADVTTQGSNQIVVTVPGQGRNILDVVQRTALLSFRQVLANQTKSPPVPSGSASATPTAPATGTPSAGNPSGSASPAASATSTAKPGKKGGKGNQGDVIRPALLRKSHNSPSPSPTPTGSPSPSVTTTPSPTSSTSVTTSPSPSTSISGPPVQVTGQVIKRGGLIVASPTLKDVQATYSKLDCSKFNNNPVAGKDVSADYMVSCSTDGTTKYLLAPSEVTPSWSTGGVKGTEVSSASSGIINGTGYGVDLNFKSTGASEWLKVTAAAAKESSPPGNVGCSTSGLGCNAVAIVLDGVVQSAPFIQDPNGIPGGTAQITGNFTQASAANLADVLNYGSLPISLDPGTSESISPTLGSSQLRGGLIAGIISLILVAVFSLVYYRALGLVAIASLAMSGLILYSVTTMLGHSRLGYTLSLAGIAGFIVAVGITADSFVVFFERMRDEVREGKRLRSGVDRAWPRARRTILSADTVSLLAAVILYLVSISDVRGFAFTLGLSTLSDLFIVFFFTKPLITLLVRRPAFDRGAPWTGIGRDRPFRRSTPPPPPSSPPPTPPGGQAEMSPAKEV